ncbi:MAG TPA: DHH family phosphoesterase [Bacillota bacterium]|jgi:c-di-AMP phosphodiesterase-like protein|nr:DHH family phosphoesterase [Bacillota bacterium]
MASKFIKNLIGPYLKAGTVTLFLFALGLFYFNIYVGISALLITVALILYYRKVTDKRTGIFEEYAKAVTDNLEDTIRHFVYKNPFPLCMIDASENLLWFNDRFQEIFEEAEMLNSNIAELTGLRYADLSSYKTGDRHLLSAHKEKLFRILPSAMDEKKDGNIMLYWLDVTNIENLKTLYNEEKICYAHINIDNYDELISAASEEKKGILTAQIETIIRQWAGKMSATMVRYKSGKYFIVFEQKHIEKIETAKFAILDEVRSVETEGDFPPSLSIGVGVGGKTLSELEEYALAALDLALGRGGDQAVVKRKSRIEYFGGKLQTVEKRNKGKSRIMAHALRQMIDQSGRVIIMGHRNPDMDSFGSALGISRIVKNRNKEGAIVLKGHSTSISMLYRSAIESGQYRFITPEEAKALTDRDTLVIVLDTHRPSLLEAPELLSMTDKIVVIDHHRKVEDGIDNATLTYMETYASSTSELVAEILQYMGDGKKAIEKLEAEALLAGITVDTKSFSIKTGVRTFEAASWLRRNGADTANVRQFFQTDMGSFKLKATIIADAEIVADGIALSVCEGRHKNVQILVSQAADELLNIQGIKASFVAGSSEDGITVVSARSLGEVNVQTIMEKMGGGGHLATAGTQLKQPLEETVEELKELLRVIDKNGGL